MSNAARASARDIPGAFLGQKREFLTFTIDKQIFGLPLASVSDVLDARPLTPVPLAPPEVAGSLNLRGRSSPPSTSAAASASRPRCRAPIT